jgi:hypothetical protein
VGFAFGVGCEGVVPTLTGGFAAAGVAAAGAVLAAGAGAVGATALGAAAGAGGSPMWIA